jgi:polyhydroxyalkanoate synthesis regulator phasin
MATAQEFKDQLTQLATDIKAEKDEVQTKLTDLAAQIQALKDQIAQGGVITQADLDAMSAQVSALRTGVQEISEPEIPPPAPTP